MGFEIRRIEIERKTYKLVKTFRISLGAMSESTVIQIRLILNGGTVGLGEASPSFKISGEYLNSVETALRELSQEFIGEDVRNYRVLFDRIDEMFRTFPSAKSALQYAILDALTAEYGLTPFEFFGGAKRKIVSDKTVGIDDVNTMVEDAKNIKGEGFRTIKIKIDSVDFALDVVPKIADATGNIGYIVDANQALKPKEAVEVAEKLHSLGVNVLVLEQPVFKHDYDGLRFVRERSPFPVAADESLYTRYDAFKLARDECVDVFNIKLMKSGLSDGMAIVEIARSAGITLMIGCMGESSLGITQSIDFAAGLGYFTYLDLDCPFLHAEDSKYRGYIRDGDELTVLDREEREKLKD